MISKLLITYHLLQCSFIYTYIYVLLKALPPVCMKYTAQGESRVANIALYLSRDPHQELYLSYKQSVNALSVLLYLTPINVRIKHSSLIILNKGIAQINGFL